MDAPCRRDRRGPQGERLRTRAPHTPENGDLGGIRPGRKLPGRGHGVDDAEIRVSIEVDEDFNAAGEEARLIELLRSKVQDL